MSEQTQLLPKRLAGFTLIEIMVSLTLMTLIIGAIGLPALSSALVRASIAKEDQALAEIRRDIERSFEDRELDTHNVSGIAAVYSFSMRPSYVASGAMGGGPDTANFTGNEWFARIARARGLSFSITSGISRNEQPALYDLIHTASGRQRVLLLGPAETTRQRYLLLSVVGRPDELTLPSYQSTQAFFDAIWDTPWDRADATLPAAWTALLSAAQVTAWNSGTPGNSRLHRLRVERITQRRHDLVINCLHPTDQVWVAYNTVATFTPGVTAAPATNFAAGSGTNTISGLLEGRIVKIFVGQTWATANSVEQTIRGRTVYTAQ